MQETWVRPLGWEDSPGEAQANSWCWLLLSHRTLELFLGKTRLEQLESSSDQVFLSCPCSLSIWTMGVEELGYLNTTAGRNPLEEME